VTVYLSVCYEDGNMERVDKDEHLDGVLGLDDDDDGLVETRTLDPPVDELQYERHSFINLDEMDRLKALHEEILRNLDKNQFGPEDRRWYIYEFGVHLLQLKSRLLLSREDAGTPSDTWVESVGIIRTTSISRDTVNSHWFKELIEVHGGENIFDTLEPNYICGRGADFNRVMLADKVNWFNIESKQWAWVQNNENLKNRHEFGDRWATTRYRFDLKEFLLDNGDERKSIVGCMGCNVWKLALPFDLIDIIFRQFGHSRITSLFFCGLALMVRNYLHHEETHIRIKTESRVVLECCNHILHFCETDGEQFQTHFEFIKLRILLYARNKNIINDVIYGLFSILLNSTNYDVIMDGLRCLRVFTYQLYENLFIFGSSVFLRGIFKRVLTKLGALKSPSEGRQLPEYKSDFFVDFDWELLFQRMLLTDTDMRVNTFCFVSSVLHIEDEEHFKGVDYSNYKHYLNKTTFDDFRPVLRWEMINLLLIFLFPSDEYARSKICLTPVRNAADYSNGIRSDGLCVIKTADLPVFVSNDDSVIAAVYNDLITRKKQKIPRARYGMDDLNVVERDGADDRAKRHRIDGKFESIFFENIDNILSRLIVLNLS